jgi:hypothetical protein
MTISQSQSSTTWYESCWMFDYAVDLFLDIVCNKFHVIFYLALWNKSQICSTKIETKDSDKIKCRFRTRVVVGQMSQNFGARIRTRVVVGQESLSDKSRCRTNVAKFRSSNSDKSRCRTRVVVGQESLSDKSRCRTRVVVGQMSCTALQIILSTRSLTHHRYTFHRLLFWNRGMCVCITIIFYVLWFC